MREERSSIQESLFPDFRCFGCGHTNPDGLHLRSFREGERVVGTFTTEPRHDNGFGFVNGGIIATLLDCHGAALVVDEGRRRGLYDIRVTSVAFVTASFEVQFRRPTPLGERLELTASPESVRESEVIVRSAITHGGKLRAEMLATWKRFTPR